MNKGVSIISNSSFVSLILFSSQSSQTSVMKIFLNFSFSKCLIKFRTSESGEVLSIYSTLNFFFQIFLIKFHTRPLQGNFLFMKFVLFKKQKLFHQENRLIFIQIICVFKKLVRKYQLRRTYFFGWHIFQIFIFNLKILNIYFFGIFRCNILLRPSFFPFFSPVEGQSAYFTNL